MTGTEEAMLLRLDYECLRSIPGGLNEVRLWWDAQLGCYRVGKRIDLSCLDDVLPEPAVLQMINHKNVVGVIAAPVINDKSLYPPPMRVIELVTPYFERGSITDALLRGERFSPSKAVQITQAILSGISNLHDVHGIAHRDIKSGNVLLTADNNPAVAKVCDLGLAGIFDEEGNVPALNNPTLYSPPEFKLASPLTVASELYSVGLILLELLKGPFPYVTYYNSEILDRLLNRKHATVEADRKPPVWASRSMKRFLAKVLKKEPNQRFQSAREMSHALSGVAYADWKKTDESSWEAPFLHNRNRRIRVIGDQKPSGEIILKTEIDSGKGWRRATNVEPQNAPALDSPQASAVFDQATNIAIAR